MTYKRILTIQDISCFGQCSLTVALPIISACGIETSIIPSAVLSTHTGGFKEYTFNDLSNDIPLIKKHWEKEKISFDAIYSGYLGNIKQIDYVIDIKNSLLKEKGLVIIDPVMGDNGKLYPAFNNEYVQNMKRLCAISDYLIPNITEACLLTNTVFKVNYDEVYINNLILKLKKIGANNIILTGVSYKEGKVGVVVCENNNISYYEHERINRNYHGTGDIFSSSFVGALLNNKTAYESSQIAADYVCECIKNTYDDKNHNYGVKFEPILYKLISKIK